MTVYTHCVHCTVPHTYSTVDLFTNIVLESKIKMKKNEYLNITISNVGRFENITVGIQLMAAKL